MASTAGNGSTEYNFKAGSVMPHQINTAGGFNPSDYGSSKVGGNKSKIGGALAFSELKGGSLAFSELKGGKKKRSRKTSRKTSRKSSKKTSKRRGKKTMKNMLKGIFGVFKK
jgi:hypothetical protein